MSTLKNIFIIIFATLLVLAMWSDIFDVTGKCALLKQCRKYPVACQELWNQ